MDRHHRFIRNKAKDKKDYTILNRQKEQIRNKNCIID
jgi:hypothetical protein